MAQHYSTRAFFRQMPNAFLARYFAAREVLPDFDFTAMKETKVDVLFDAWMALSEASRSGMESELREISGMSNEKGVAAIIDEALFHMNEDGEHEAFVAKLMALLGHHERAMTVFLDHAPMWKGATRFYHADTLSYWRKRKNLPKVAAAVAPADIAALSEAIRVYYNVTDGRAKHCKVEPYRRGKLDYFFAFPEDYAQNAPEWRGEDIELQSRHPPFEIVFVYDSVDGRLDLHLDGDKKAAEPLQAIFAEHILKCPELPADPADNRVYNLAPLRQRNFNFAWAVGSGIESVAVNKLRLGLYKPKNAKLVIEADPKHNPKAVYDLLDKLSASLPSHEYYVTQVGITAMVKPNATAAAKSVTFTVSQPCSCSLKYDEIGLRLRAMLEASNVEPKSPPEGEAPTDNAVSPAPTE